MTEVRVQAVYNIARFHFGLHKTAVFEALRSSTTLNDLSPSCISYPLGRYSKFFFLRRSLQSYPAPTLMSSPSQREPYGDPFADRPRQTHFQEPPPRSYNSATNSPFESTTTLPRDFGGAAYGDEDYAEKLPLTAGESFNAGAYYPPG